MFAQSTVEDGICIYYSYQIMTAYHKGWTAVYCVIYDIQRKRALEIVTKYANVKHWVLQ